MLTELTIVPAAPVAADDRTDGTTLEGTILDGSRGQYHVQTADGVLLCTLRGKLRKELIHPISHNILQKAQRANIRARDPVTVGDRVRLVPMGGGKGVIDAVVDAETGAFAREDADKGRVRTAAGLDQLVIVLATRDPAPHLGVLDRFLVFAEAQDLPAVICLNKVDLGVDPDLAARLAYYAGLGYAVVQTSVATGAGLAALRARLAGRTSVLLGPSGVGKSSLLNALEPGLGQRVRAVSAATHKGRHTTVGTRLIPLGGPEGGALVDTAGIRALSVRGAAAGRLDGCFPEFRPYLGTCFHADCTHRQEPGCAVRVAVAAGALDAARYASYGRLYADGGGTAGRAWRDVVSSRSLAGEGELRL